MGGGREGKGREGRGEGLAIMTAMILAGIKL